MLVRSNLGALKRMGWKKLARKRGGGMEKMRWPSKYMLDSRVTSIPVVGDVIRDAISHPVEI
eukprot:4526472-Pyramimonas_sp.AAC.1